MLKELDFRDHSLNRIVKPVGIWKASLQKGDMSNVGCWIQAPTLEFCRYGRLIIIYKLSTNYWNHDLLIETFSILLSWDQIQNFQLKNK